MEVGEAPYISDEEFKELWGYNSLSCNDFTSFPEATAAMELQITNHPLFKEEFNGPEPCNPCGGRTQKSMTCHPYKCVTYQQGLECSSQCHNNRCKNRRLSKGDYEDVMQIGASKVDPTSLGLFARKSVAPGRLIGEFVGVLKMGAHVPEEFCIAVGSPIIINEGTQVSHLYLDAIERGNVARNVQSSSNPNCCYVTLICGKSYRVGLVATKYVKKRTELLVENPSFPSSHIYEIRDSLRPLESTVVRAGPSSQFKKARVMMDGLGPIGGIGTFKPGLRTINSPIPPGAFRHHEINSLTEDSDDSNDDNNN